MKIEVGKKYKDESGQIVEILSEAVSKDSNYSMFVGHGTEYRLYHPDGLCDYLRTNVPPGGTELVSEYKEPVVHERDVVWLKDSKGKTECYVWFKGQSIKDYNFKELRRETVSYTEE